MVKILTSFSVMYFHHRQRADRVSGTWGEVAASFLFCVSFYSGLTWTLRKGCRKDSLHLVGVIYNRKNCPFVCGRCG